MEIKIRGEIEDLTIKKKLEKKEKNCKRQKKSEKGRCCRYQEGVGEGFITFIPFYHDTFTLLLRQYGARRPAHL